MFVPLSVLEFRDRAELFFKDKIGVIDGDKRFTYEQFAERTHRLANALRDLGVQPGDRISFMTYNTHQLLEAYYGVLEAGAVLNPINVRLNATDIAYILDHSASRVLFYHKDFTPLVAAFKPQLQETKQFVVMEGDLVAPATHEYEGLLAGASPEYNAPEIDENAIAELFYTSGTTGRPKGVALTHRNLHLHALYTTMALQFDDTARILHIVPLFHVNGWGTPHTVTLQGGTHVMLRKVDPTMMLSLIEKERITHVLGVPFIFNALVNHPELGKYDLSSIKRLMTGGAPASPTLIKAMQEKLGGLATVGYGLSETTPVICLATPRVHLSARETLEQKMARQATTGWAIPGSTLRVVDSHDRDVPADGEHIGEIVVRSNVVMLGYYKDPQATAAAIRDGWFHTGDMATIDGEGYILIKDRSKDIIISGGENISSVEIENALYTHPAVFECAVVAAPDEKWGEVPVAVVSLKPGAQATADELMACAREKLPVFMVPKRIEFRDQLPKGGTGKILKAEIRQPYWVGRDKHVN
ncbi:MAG: long-chain-fatty-acid--CoA ligase [Anaerolineae bacterium]